MRRLFFAIFGVIFCGFFAGCRTMPSDRLEPGFPDSKALAAPNRLQALVLPFEDARDTKPPTSSSQPILYQIPLIGLGTFFVPLDHRHPEATLSQAEALLAFETPASYGDLAEALPRTLATRLTDSGALQAADYWPALPPGTDVRRYDYVMTGRIVESTVREYHYSYGLGVLGIADLSVVPKLLALPDRRLEMHLGFEWQLTERSSGRVVAGGRENWSSKPRLAGYYYNRTPDGQSPVAFLLGEAIRHGEPGMMNRVKENLP